MIAANLANFFCWSALINFGILLLWLVIFSLRRESIYKMHGKMFGVSKEQLVCANYTLFGLFKIFIFFFNLVPLLALKLMGG